MSLGPPGTSRQRQMERRLSMADKQASSIRAVYGKTEDRYLDLIRRFPLRPLRKGAELDAAVTVIDELIDRAALTAPGRTIWTC
jgi:hypothetical protein